MRVVLVTSNSRVRTRGDAARATLLLLPLKQETDALLQKAEKTDAEGDALPGKDRHADELPAELQ